MNGWKVTAIVFIILFILETIFFISIVSIGFSDLNKENQCMYNVCGGESYDSYVYYEFEGICECYKSGIVKKMEYIE